MEQLLLNYINEQIFAEFMYRNPNRISRVKYIIDKESNKICSYYCGDSDQFRADITWSQISINTESGETLYIYLPEKITLTDDINYEGIFWEVERQSTNLEDNYHVSKYEKTVNCKQLLGHHNQFIKDIINFEIPIFVIIETEANSDYGELIKVQRVFSYKNSKAYYKTTTLTSEAMKKFVLSDFNILDGTNANTVFSNNSNIKSNMLNYVLNIDIATDTQKQFRFRTVKEALNSDHNFAICDFHKIDTNCWLYNESTIDRKKKERNTRNANFTVDSDGIIKSIQVTEGNIGSNELYTMNISIEEDTDYYVITIETIPAEDPLVED